LFSVIPGWLATSPFYFQRKKKQTDGRNTIAGVASIGLFLLSVQSYSKNAPFANKLF
jgi:hypothetical protein